ncbi:hypothetical protein RQP46_009195 [Phenoliferia psychrophenolica]
MTSTTTYTRIPTFYRIFFTLIDPLMCLGGVLGCLVFPSSTLTSYTPSALGAPITPSTSVLLDSTAGWFLGMAFLQFSLLRARPYDVVVWRAVQVALVCVDLTMWLGLVRALVVEGRMADTANWRGGDWGNVVGYPALVAVRVAFLVGIGMGEGKGRRK